MDDAVTQPVDIARMFEEGTPIDEALARAAAAARRHARLLGHPLPVWRDGRVTWLSPHQIVVDEPVATGRLSISARPSGRS